MFLISINYIKPLEEVDALLDAHLEYLEEQYKNRKFIVSGGKIPRTGGIILAVGENRLEIQQLIEKDPFYTVAEYEITEFIPKMALSDFKNLKKDKRI